MTDNLKEEEQQVENLFSEVVDADAFSLGIKHASYIGGLGFGLKQLTSLSDEIIGTILTNKMFLEYQQEMQRMELQTRENIAEKMMSYEEIEGEF